MSGAAPESPCPCGVLRRFPRGQLLVHAGSVAEMVYLVRSGQVRVYQLRAGGEEVTTAVLGPGQLAGVESLVRRSVYHAFVEALTPVEVWAMPAVRLLACLPTHQAMLALVVEALGRRLSLVESLLGDVVLLPVRQRVQAVLPALEPCLGGERARLSREVLASLVGARRESVSRASSGARAVAA